MWAFFFHPRITQSLFPHHAFSVGYIKKIHFKDKQLSRVSIGCAKIFKLYFGVSLLIALI